jgi:sulfite reductase (NADPH) hemoprotein beta-component
MRMYRYQEEDHRLLAQRVEQFRGQVKRYLNNELDDNQFRQLRLRNGLYLERNAHMLRVAIPYGLLSSAQLRKLAYVARVYDRGYGHFTTRQNIQYNWPELNEVPDLLADLAEVEMHAIQTSGSCVRNVTADHLAGVAADEIADPRPYCEMLRLWSTLHPEFNWLPRKFKIAVTGATTDRAAVRWHDIGLALHRNDQGALGLRVLVGGGMGRTPVIGKVIREFLPERHLLSYVEAILRVYNLLGRRDNIHKARIKILVNALGIDAFRELVEEEWQRILEEGALELSEHEIAQMQAHFTPPAYEPGAAEDPDAERHAAKNPQFARWLTRNTLAHKIPGYRIVTIPLKAPGAPPGDATAAQMDLVAALAERYSASRIRTTHDQNLVLSDVKQGDLYALWRTLDGQHLAMPNVGTLNDMICCPGLEFCTLANASSIKIAKQINERFDDLDYLYDLGDIQLKISGCMNACGHHHAGHIGILGVEKGGAEWYQITLGGAPGNDAALGQRLGHAIPQDAVAETIAKILGVYLAARRSDERFIDTYRRIGISPFQEQVYASDKKSQAGARRVAA